jgi:DNA polymerase
MLDKQTVVTKIKKLAEYYQNILHQFGDNQPFSMPKPHNPMPMPEKKQKIVPQEVVQMQTKSVPLPKPQSNNNIFSEIANDVSKINTLPELKTYTETKPICDIQKFATKTVFGDGNSEAKILVIGEAPGQEEDLAGVPFCGRSGELLMNAFACINLERQKNFYITNNIFWRPPGNRKPTDEELLACKPILNKIIEIINPKVIICVGSVAVQNILEVDDSISTLRQKELTSKHYPQKIFAIYHPSYLLRNPSKKYEMYKDLLFINGTIEGLN